MSRSIIVLLSVTITGIIFIISTTNSFSYLFRGGRCRGPKVRQTLVGALFMERGRVGPY